MTPPLVSRIGNRPELDALIAAAGDKDNRRVLRPILVRLALLLLLAKGSGYAGEGEARKAATVQVFETSNLLREGENRAKEKGNDPE